MKKNELVKHNVNFLEYPLWFQDNVIAAKSDEGFIWKDREGYVYRSGYKIPTKTDAIFLLYFLLQSQKCDYQSELTVSRYKVLKDCGLSIDSKWYSRLQESLDRWLRVDVAFKGKFYDGKDYQHVAFHIIDAWSIDKSSAQLKISFSPHFLKMMLGKGFFKYVNFNEFKALRSPLATRLYEILSKSFSKRSVWEIDAIKLAEKIPMNERFPANIIPKIKTAIKRINKHVKEEFQLEIRRPKRGKAIFRFQKTMKVDQLQETEVPQQPALPISQEEPALLSLYKLLPAERQNQKTLREMITRAWKIHGFDYVARNIRYTIKNSRKNFRKFLSQSLQADWGQVLIEDEETQIRTKELQQKAARKAWEERQTEEKKRDLELELQKRAREYQRNLPQKALEALRQEAILRLPKDMQEHAITGNPAAKILLKISMDKLSLERMNIDIATLAEEKSNKES